MEAAYQNTPVCRHAAHFGNPDGTLTMESIMKGQEDWGITGKMAKI